jgi:hypothetical protein
VHISRALPAVRLSYLLRGHGTSFQDGVAAGEGFLLLSRSVITVQHEFRARFKKDASHMNNVFFKPCVKLTLHCNHRSGHHKTEHTGSLLLLRRQLGNWSCGPAISMSSELLTWETWTFPAAIECVIIVWGEK